jgi:hypothetical protein
LQKIGKSLTQVLNCFRKQDLNLFVLVLDLAIPPISLFIFYLIAISGLCAINTAAGGSIMLTIGAIGSLVLLLSTIGVCWVSAGRTILSFRDVLAVAPFLARKAQLYFGMVSGSKVTEWTRTDRE